MKKTVVNIVLLLSLVSCGTDVTTPEVDYSQNNNQTKQVTKTPVTTQNQKVTQTKPVTSATTKVVETKQPVVKATPIPVQTQTPTNAENKLGALTEENKLGSLTAIKTTVNIGENFDTKTILAGVENADSITKVNELATKYNFKVQNFMKPINTFVISVNGQDAKQLIDNLSKENLFTFIETDHISSNKPEEEKDVPAQSFKTLAEVVPNDVYFSSQYGLKAIKAPEAWTITKGQNAIISVIDSGVDIDHVELEKRVYAGYDALSKKTGESAGDVSGLNYIFSSYKHGSHVAGIISAEMNNKYGIAGVAPESHILPVKIFPDFSDFFTTSKESDGSAVTVVSAIADGIVWSADHKADVINMSLAVWDYSITLERAVKYAIDNGTCVVVAAGNERHLGNKKNYLAAYKDVIGVGATDAEDKITFFSNSGDYVSVTAPGYDIISSVPSFLSLRPYVKMSGTSMAAPHVSGVVALLRSKFGRDVATPQWIKQRLESTATDLGIPGKDELYGYGLINAFKALNDPI